MGGDEWVMPYPEGLPDEATDTNRPIPDEKMEILNFRNRVCYCPAGDREPHVRNAYVCDQAPEVTQ